MPGPAFTELVGRLIESMGQSVDAVTQRDDAILLRTSDRFVYAFLEDPNRVSLAQVETLLGESKGETSRLSVLTPGRLPLALTAELLRNRATVVDGERFHELARGLGLASFLGEEPTAHRPKSSARLLPSARQLDEVMGRARTWMDWGVPAIALRFYRQAAHMKPGFLPARTGIGRALAQIGLWEDAGRAFDDVLQTHPGDLDARLGRAALLGASGRIPEELEAYRALRDEAPERLDIQTYLIAALLEARQWGDAQRGIERFLEVRPEDPQVRFLYSLVLGHTSTAEAARRERERARALGLSAAQESSLSAHLGVPPPASPSSPAGGSPAVEPSGTTPPPPAAVDAVPATGTAETPTDRRRGKGRVHPSSRRGRKPQ